MRIIKSENKRLIKIIHRISLLLTVGLFYNVFVIVTGWGIPCIIHSLTGFNCPGCGITRMCVNISKLQFKKAFEYNRFIFITWPFIMYEIILELYNYVNYRKTKRCLFHNIVILLYVVLLISWGIARNFWGI